MLLKRVLTPFCSVNKAEGWATGFDPKILQQAQDTAQTKLEAHIAILNDPTVDNVIGGKKAIKKEYPVLPSSLPNSIKTIGARYDKLPDVLQQKIEFAFGKNLLGGLINAEIFSFARLNNEKVTLSFKAASKADENALEALIPDNISDVNQLPTVIPSYIKVVPELKVNNVTVKTGGVMNLGEELNFVTSNRLAGRGYITVPQNYKVIAGSFLNVNVIAGSVSPLKMDNLQAKMKATKANLESSDLAQIASLTRDDILGDIFYAGALGYYGQLFSHSYISGLQAKGYFQLLVGSGTIGYVPDANYFFGAPTEIKQGSVVLNIPINIAVANQANDANKAKWFTMQMGRLGSSLEHSIPERMFAPIDSNLAKPDAISTIKALHKANLAGQRIYHINQENMNQVLPYLHHNQDVLNNIRSALIAGKEVTTHTDAVSIPGGWSGFGYIITDPEHGDGAYLISGELNGGVLGLLKRGINNIISIINNLPKPLKIILRATVLASLLTAFNILYHCWRKPGILPAIAVGIASAIMIGAIGGLAASIAVPGGFLGAVAIGMVTIHVNSIIKPMCEIEI